MCVRIRALEAPWALGIWIATEGGGMKIGVHSRSGMPIAKCRYRKINCLAKKQTKQDRKGGATCNSGNLWRAAARGGFFRGSRQIIKVLVTHIDSREAKGAKD